MTDLWAPWSGPGLVPGHWPLVTTACSAGSGARLQLTAVLAGVIGLDCRLQAVCPAASVCSAGLHQWLEAAQAGATKDPPFRYILQPGLNIITTAHTRPPAPAQILQENRDHLTRVSSPPLLTSALTLGGAPWVRPRHRQAPCSSWRYFLSSVFIKMLNCSKVLNISVGKSNRIKFWERIK